MPNRLVINDPKKQKDHASKKAAKGKKFSDLKPAEKDDLLLRVIRQLGMVDANDVLI